MSVASFFFSLSTHQQREMPFFAEALQQLIPFWHLLYTDDVSHRIDLDLY